MPSIIRPAEERFWGKVQKTEDLWDCWEWRGGKTKHGYGVFWLKKRQPIGAHRFVYALTRGSVPDGLFVLHDCDNPSCVNPCHLSVGTQADNIADCQSKGRFRPLSGGSKDRNPRARLTQVQVDTIRHCLANGETQTRVALRYGISQGHVSSIAVGRRWRET